MTVEVKHNPERWPWPYELWIDARYVASFGTEPEAYRAAEREQLERADMEWRRARADSRPPLTEWTLDEIIAGYSPYDAHHYSTKELDAELARRLGLTGEEVGRRRIADVLLERKLIDRATWERITDFWDEGVAW